MNNKKKTTIKANALKADPLKTNDTKSDATHHIVQVYNINQEVTKKMLKNLLEPYVISIDFKTKSESVKKSENDETETNNSEINEKNVDVLIKFENFKKFQDAIKFLNLNELDLELDSKKKENLENIDQPISKDKSPFLLKSLSLF